MGLPDNRDLEPIRNDYIDGYNNEPAIVMNQIEQNEPRNEQMEVDDESDVNNGYLRLQTFDNHEDQPADDSDSSGSDEDEENEYAFNYDNILPTSSDPEPLPEPENSDLQVISAEGEIEAEVWNAPRPQDTIELNSEKTQQILKAMSSFTLPNVPQWANEVNPRELIQRIRAKDKESSAPASKTH